MKIALTVIILSISSIAPPVSFFDTMQDCIDEKERIERSLIVTVFRGTVREIIDMAKDEYKIVCSPIN